MHKQSLVLAVACFLAVAVSLADTNDKVTQCYSCRGISCQRTTGQNITENCVDNQDVCVTIFNKFSVEAKGCFTSLPIELRQKCEDSSSPECRSCSGSKCNDLGRSDFRCYECSAKETENCAKNPSALGLVQCKAPTSPNSYCYTDVASDGSVRRGCMLHVKEQTECYAREGCTLCSVEDGEGCNYIAKDNTGGASSGAALSGAIALVAICFVGLVKL